MPDGIRVRERLYLDGRRIYMLFAAADQDSKFLNSATANRFFDSFRIADEVGDLSPERE